METTQNSIPSTTENPVETPGTETPAVETVQGEFVQTEPLQVEMVQVSKEQLELLLQLNASVEAQRDHYKSELKAVLNSFTPIMEALGIGEGKGPGSKEPSVMQMMTKLPKLIQQGDLFKGFSEVMERNTDLID